MPRRHAKCSTQESTRAPDKPLPVEEMLIGEQIRALRRIKGLRLQQLADQAGISIGYLSQIERNRSKLTIGVLEANFEPARYSDELVFSTRGLGPDGGTELDRRGRPAPKDVVHWLRHLGRAPFAEPGRAARGPAQHD